MRKAIEESSFWILAALIALAGGALIVPLGYEVRGVVYGSLVEVGKGELEDAKNY